MFDRMLGITKLLDDNSACYRKRERILQGILVAGMRACQRDTLRYGEEEKLGERRLHSLPW